ncbi:hypothetical protein ACWEKT_26890 [Nocardia takedensis]
MNIPYRALTSFLRPDGHDTESCSWWRSLVARLCSACSRTVVIVDAAAAAEIDRHSTARSRGTAASELIALGAQVIAVAGGADSVLIRDATGFDTVVALTDPRNPMEVFTR